MLRLAFDFIITWRETRTRPNAYTTTKDCTEVKADKETTSDIHEEKRSES